MAVYDGQKAIGQIDDHGGRVLAFRLTASGRVAMGEYPTRRTAIAADENAREIHAGTAG